MMLVDSGRNAVFQVVLGRVLSAIGAGPAEGRPPPGERLAAIKTMFSSAPKGLTAHFSPGFLATVPEAKLKPIFSDYFKKAGPDPSQACST